MQIDAELHFQNHILHVKGALNFTTVTRLYENSLAYLTPKGSFIIDLREVVEANSAGLALMLEWLKWGKANHTTIRFEHVPAALQSIAKAADLEDWIN